MKYSKYGFLLLLFIWASCAQIVSPGGGPRDTTPPKVVSYSSDSIPVNFSAKEVVITFDEYITLKDLNGQLVVSPPMKTPPEIKAKGKELVVLIDDTLRKNTTYKLSFGSAIRDLREDNPLDNFQYVFSTGPKLDSLYLSGSVLNGFDQKPEKGVLVMLYDIDEQKKDVVLDSLPYKILPSYFSKTDEYGNYKINYLKAGRYKLFALKDGNSDYLYNSANELIGFKDSLINLKKSSSVDMLVFKEEPQKQYLKRSQAIEYGHLQFVFNKPIQNVADVTIEPLNFTSKKQWKLEEFRLCMDTLDLWLLDIGLDTLQLKVKFDQLQADTVTLSLKKKPDPKATTKGGKGGADFSFKHSINAKKDSPFNLNDDLTLVFNHPITEVEKKSIVFKEDTSVIAYSLKYDPLSKADYGRVLRFVKTKENAPATTIEKQREANSTVLEGVYVVDALKLNENKHYSFYAAPGSFKDIFGLINDTIKVAFTTNEVANYGTLKLKITGKLPPNSAIQLVNEKGVVVSPTSIITKDGLVYDYKNLIPGNYRVKNLIDLNADLKWTTGNYLKKVQPEKVIYYPSTLTIRPNWDLEQEWKVE